MCCNCHLGLARYRYFTYCLYATLGPDDNGVAGGGVGGVLVVLRHVLLLDRAHGGGQNQAAQGHAAEQTSHNCVKEQEQYYTIEVTRKTKRTRTL